MTDMTFNDDTALVDLIINDQDLNNMSRNVSPGQLLAYVSEFYEYNQEQLQQFNIYFK